MKTFSRYILTGATLKFTTLCHITQFRGCHSLLCVFSSGKDLMRQKCVVRHMDCLINRNNRLWAIPVTDLF